MAKVQETQKTITYKGRKAYEKGLREMQKDGWKLANVATNQPRSGILRFIMLGGIGALVFKRKQEFIATFERV